MATITPTQSRVGNGLDQLVVTWAAMTNSGSDVGAPVELARFSDRSVQVTGTWGAGGNVRIEGSNDGTNYVVLTDPQGNALNLSSAGIEQIMEITRYIRPQITGGDGTTSITVSMFLRGVK